MKKRIAAILCVTALILGHVFFVMPETASAEDCSGVAGEVLSIRVQYAGEREDKIREKTSYTAAELKGMGAAVYRYTNVTNVGTVMQIVAVGPRLSDIINAAGVDINSIKMITFKTTDGYSRNFTVGEHLQSTRYYYPNLPKNYERNIDAGTLIPLEGSLSDAVTVPSIIALESDSTKNPNRVLDEGDMRLDESFRFCLGQPPLKEGLETVPNYDGGDVSSMNSAQLIYAVDLTLYGSPVEGINLDIDAEDLKVGSEKKISVTVEGDALFADEFGEIIDQLTWSSSNPEVVSVSEDGVITVIKEGTAVITATAPDGMTASVTIDTSGKGEDPPEKTDTTAEPDIQDSDKTDNGQALTDNTKDDEGQNKNDRDKAVKEDEKSKEEAATILVKEVTIQELASENANDADAYRKEMAADAQALDKAEDANPVTVLLSGYTALLAAGFGAAFRVRRYFREV